MITPALFVKDPDTGKVLVIEPGGELADVLQGFYSQECGHAETTLMRVKTANGHLSVRNCCTSCGERVGTAVSQKQGAAWLDTLPWQSDELTQTYTTRRHAEKQQLLLSLARRQYEERGKFTKSYREYLTSSKWKAKRGLILKRCANVCEGCGTATATEVHHVTYKHFGDEFLFELLGLCHDCHEKISSERWSETDVEAHEAEYEADISDCF